MKGFKYQHNRSRSVERAEFGNHHVKQKNKK